MSEDKLSCGVVLARATDDGYVTLMLRAYHHWDFPKGMVEDGETPFDAALREIASHGPTHQRIGLKPEGKRPAREGCAVLSQAGEVVGMG